MYTIGGLPPLIAFFTRITRQWVPSWASRLLNVFIGKGCQTTALSRGLIRSSYNLTAIKALISPLSVFPETRTIIDQRISRRTNCC